MHEGEAAVADETPGPTDPGVSADPGGDFTTEFLRAAQLLTFGRFEAVDRTLAEAMRRAVSDHDLAAAAMGRASVRFWHLADVAGAHRLLDEVTARLGASPSTEELEAQRAVLWLFGGRTARAVVVCRGVQRRARGSTQAMLLSASIDAIAHGMRGEVELEAEPPRRPDDALDALQFGYYSLARRFAHVMNGRIIDPDGATPSPDLASRAEMAESSEGMTHMLDAMSLLWAGRPRSAVAELEPAVAHLRHSDRAHLLPAALGQLAYGHALLGDADAAERAADDAEEIRHPVACFPDLFLDHGRAWAEAARGELSAARDRLAAAAEASERRGQAVPAALAWYDIARLGDPARSAPRLARLATWWEGRRTAAGEPPDGDGILPMFAAHTAALVAGDPDGVADAALWARRRGHLLHAAEAAAQAAALHGRSRRRADADRWRELASELAGACEGARTPALAPLHDLDLTPREREIVGLAAQGLTNPDIARRLHVSVRTVGNHLQASYVKLGIHRREELAHLQPFGVEA